MIKNERSHLLTSIDIDNLLGRKYVKCNVVNQFHIVAINSFILQLSNKFVDTRKHRLQAPTGVAFLEKVEVLVIERPPKSETYARCVLTQYF